MYHILSIYKMTMRDGVGSRGELIQVSIVRIGSVAVAGSNCNNTAVLCENSVSQMLSNWSYIQQMDTIDVIYLLYKDGTSIYSSFDSRNAA